MTTAHHPRKMTIADYETLKAKKNKTDQDYMRINFFEEKFYNKSGKLANEFRSSQLPKLLEEYADYIESPDAVRAIYARVDKLAYSKGELVTTDKWPHRNHTVTVNGIDFDTPESPSITAAPSVSSIRSTASCMTAWMPKTTRSKNFLRSSAMSAMAAPAKPRLKASALTMP